MNRHANFDRMTPSTGSLYAGQLVRGALLAASDRLSRLHRWAMSATGPRTNATHGNHSPQAQPSPVDGIPAYAVLRRKSDGQMMPLEIRIPTNTPADKFLRAAYWEIWSHPETAAFSGTHGELTVEQVALRPERNQNLRSPLDVMIYHQNLRTRLDSDAGQSQ